MKITRVTISQDCCKDWISICKTLSKGLVSASYISGYLFIISHAITNMKSLMITNQMESFPHLGVQYILSFFSKKNCLLSYSFIHSSIHSLNIHLSTKYERQRLTNHSLWPQRSSILAEYTGYIKGRQIIAYLEWFYSCGPSCLFSKVLL